MERKIGEIFEYNGEWYQTVEAPIDEHSCNGCQGCKGTGGPHIFGGECNGNVRKDNKFVIFKKLEKVGEPTIIMSKMVQEFKNNNNNHCEYCCFNKDCHPLEIASICDLHNSFFVELKQNKEDMEENKLNLKPFDIQKARAGKPVCTRDGRKARIICFDKKGDFPIVALVNDYNEEEYIKNYDKFGKRFIDGETTDDLMMLPEKKEGYVNLYHNCNDRYAAYLGNKVIYKDKEFAEDMGRGDINYIKTVKVQWEE